MSTTTESLQSISIEESWVRSDRYHNSFLIPHDDALELAVKHSEDNGLPAIQVSTAQGKYLNLLARSIKAKNILEVGTLGGYSAIWLARALPEDGHLITCELKQKYAEVAKANLERAGVSSRVEILVGPAAQTLPTLQPEEPFDFAFIDADKPSNLIYFLEAKRLVRKGGVIIVDNVVREGLVADPDYKDEMYEGVRTLLGHLKNDKEVDATTVAWVGEKNYDGFLYAVLL